MTPIEEPKEVEIPRGLIAEASAPLPVIQFPDGHTEPAPAGSVLAENIIGQLTNEQIQELEAAKISGKLTAEQIESIEAAQIVGLIVSEQISGLAAGKITGELEAAQIKSLPTGKLTGFITNEQIEEISASKITGTIIETQIGNESITTPKIKALAITAAKIAAGSVVAEKIAAEAVESNKIKALAITAAKIAAGAIIAEKIGAEAVEAVAIKALTITAAKIAANAITTEKVNALAITTAKLAAESIIAEKISAGAITTTKIAASAVTAEKITVEKLSALSADLGEITAGTLTGAIHRTAAGNPRIEMNSEGLLAINAEGTKIVSLLPTGLNILAFELGSGGESEKGIFWKSAAGKNVAEFRARRNPAELEENRLIAFAGEGAAGTAITIIMKNGNSDFVFCGEGVKKRAITAGFATLKFVASKIPEGPKKINHGLGRVPIAVVANSENNVCTISTSSYTTTQFSLWGGNWFEPISGELNVHWIAFG